MKLILKYAVVGILIPVYCGGFGVVPATKVQASPAISCKKKIIAIGQPNRIESVANLNAIGAWISRAQEHGKDYAQWLSASKASVDCEKKGSSQFYLCRASGKPCLSG